MTTDNPASRPYEEVESPRRARLALYDLMDQDIPFEEKVSGALAIGKQYLDMENGHFTQIDNETDHWEALISTDPPEGNFPPGLKLDLGTTYCRRTITEDEPISLHDAPNQGWENDPAFQTHELHSYHGTTVNHDGEPYGTVCFVSEDSRDRPFETDETMFAELITKLLETELEHNQYEEQLIRQSNLTNVLNRVLRHNLRNDLSVVRGRVDMLMEETEQSQNGEIAIRMVDKLLNLSEKARGLEWIVAEEF